MKRVLPALVVLVLNAGVVGGAARAEIAEHVVISEIQIGNEEGANNEFVELYNPTIDDVDLSGWRLRVGAGGNLISSMSGILKARGFFLVANPAYTTIAVAPDMTYSATSSAITANSFITLQKKTEGAYEEVDKVGMGSAGEFEGTAVAAPAPGSSIERKSSDAGVESLGGNGWDTDDNAADFVMRQTPEPQNSQSPTEPDVSPTGSPTPTLEPSPTEMPPTPTIEPAPTGEPTPTETPNPTITPGPPPGETIVTEYLTCTISYKPKKLWKFIVWFPELDCYRTERS